MKGATNGKHEDGASGDITGKEDGKARQTEHEHLLAGETIDYISTEWSDDESCHGIAAQYDSNGILRCSESLAQIEWEQGSKKVEGKVQQEIGCHHLHIVCIPEFLFIR